MTFRVLDPTAGEAPTTGQRAPRLATTSTCGLAAGPPRAGKRKGGTVARVCERKSKGRVGVPWSSICQSSRPMGRPSAFHMACGWREVFMRCVSSSSK